MFHKLKSLFSKKDKLIESVKLSENEMKWNKLWDLYSNSTWNNPIFYLCDYDSGINGEGHFCFFDNKGNEMKTYVEELKKVLPENLFDNFNKAYQIWLRGNDEQTEKHCEVADDFFYQNENTIIEILQQFANTLEI